MFEIPDSVTSIGNYAFSSCFHLLSIVIPTTITSIGTSAFCRFSNWKTIIIWESVSANDSCSFIYCYEPKCIFHYGESHPTVDSSAYHSLLGTAVIVPAAYQCESFGALSVAKGTILDECSWWHAHSLNRACSQHREHFLNQAHLHSQNIYIIKYIHWFDFGMFEWSQ